MTVTLDTRTLIVMGVVFLIAATLSGGRWGCRALSGCLVGVVCLGIGLVLLGMSGLMGG